MYLCLSKQIDNSPDAVKNHLPSQAAEIFRTAFNNAEQEYGEDISRNWATIIAAAFAGKTIGSNRGELGVDWTIGQPLEKQGEELQSLGSRDLSLLKVVELNGHWLLSGFPTHAAWPRENLQEEIL